jgi:hypothetical protein
MDLEGALPRLLVNYRRGVLVPFIGSGMSRPACTSWPVFVDQLAAAAGEPPETTAGEPTSMALYRKADRCVRRLKARGYDDLVRASRDALGLVSTATIPDNTRALAELYWPLVLSTNYDDLLLRAAFERRGAVNHAGDRQLFELAGQSVADCHRVLRSLDMVMPPMLWALQGYLGGRDWTQPPLSEARTRRLAHEIVIGHQQYQAVINAQPHLRRAVAELFRRRSLLFLGSGVQEDYLINLFSEIIHHHGLSAHAHFAVFHDSERPKIDEGFFRLRLGIEPLFIKDFGEIAWLLRQLRANRSAAIATTDARTSVAGCEPYELTYRLVGRSLTLRIRHDVPEPGAGCIGISVGRDRGGVLHGRQARSALRAFHREDDPTRWQRCDDDGYVYRHADEPALFAIAAREADQQGDGDRRHLTVIPKALRAFLGHVDSQGYQTATVGLLAAGQDRGWPALFPFVMMLKAIHDYAPRGLREIVICVVDPSVWFPLLAGVPIELLLSADAGTVWAHVGGDDDEAPDSYAITLTGGETVADVARHCGLPRGRWRVAVYPMPSGKRPDGAPDHIAVVPGASISFMATTDVDDTTFELT